MIVGGGTVPATNFTRQDVHRPRPPHVAVISIPAACAVFKMEVAGGRESVRWADGSRGSVRMVRGTAMPPHSSGDRKSTRLNSSHRCISYAVFCLKKKTE